MSDEPLSVDALQERLGQSPFISLLNLTVVSADPAKQQLVMRAAMRPEFERGRGSGQWHGGPIAAIIDTVGDYALVMLLGRSLPTVNFRVDYLRPAIDTALVVTAAQRQIGRGRRHRCGERHRPAPGDRPGNLRDRPLIWVLAAAHAPEGDRITQALGGRDTVLPLRPRRAAHHID